jgi:ketosteroid isomerase-like protein
MSESNLEDVQRSTISSRAIAARLTMARSRPWSIASVDAILKSPVIDINGRDEIRAFANRFAAQRAAGTQFRHMVSNIAVTITGNRAAASAYLLVLISKHGNHRSLPPGRYACELTKEDSGQWRFSRCTVFHDHDCTLDGIGR